MFNNWFNPYELAQFTRRIRVDPMFRQRLIKKLHITRHSRIKASWAHTESLSSGWWDIPEIQKRWNMMISGDEEVTHREYVVRKYYSNYSMLNGLSIGCGSGGSEINWARTGIFRNIDAYDLSPKRILAAVKSSAELPEGKIINYNVGDINLVTLPDSAYDIVLFEHSLHHFSAIEGLLRRIASTLKPGGLLVANEFVGPSRFQWTDVQLTVVNTALADIPPSYRTVYGSSYLKDRVIRPSKLRMWMSDPSEAVESSKILPMLSSQFHIMETRGYGGAVLHLLFSDIAHHFTRPDAIGDRILQRCFRIEDAMLSSHELEHDFALIICRRDAHSPA